MEERLIRLFDFQGFEGNADLQAVIDAVHARYSARELSDDEADFVAAAGTPGTALRNKDPKEDRK